MIFVMLPGLVFCSLPAPFEKGLPVSHAMILSTIIVLVVCRGELTAKVKAFFEGPHRRHFADGDIGDHRSADRVELEDAAGVAVVELL